MVLLINRRNAGHFVTRGEEIRRGQGPSPAPAAAAAGERDDACQLIRWNYVQILSIGLEFIYNSSLIQSNTVHVINDVPL